MTRCVVLNEEGIAHLESVIQYNWGDERRDFESCETENENSREGHVFRSLVFLDNCINDTSHVAEDRCEEKQCSQ